MSRNIPTALRLLVSSRAKHRFEYCRLPAAFSFFKFHNDHIKSLKHGGLTIAENLAYACQICNENKGSDIATFLENSNTLIRFFNPRIDAWKEHFLVEDTGEIIPLSDVGAATIKIFKFNHPESLIERRGLIDLGLYA